MTLTIKVDMNKVVLVKGMRYMTNTATKNKKGESPIFPYSQERIDRCPSMKEIHPEFEDDAPEVGVKEEKEVEMVVSEVEIVKPSLKLEVPAFSLEEPMIIENPVVTSAQQKEMAKTVDEPKESQKERAQRIATTRFKKTGK